MSGCGSEVDVAIVGAGPGGAYAAYNLRNKGLTVALYEYSGELLFGLL